MQGTSPHPSREGEDKQLPAEGLLASGLPTPVPSRIAAMVCYGFVSGYSGGAAQDFNLLP